MVHDKRFSQKSLNEWLEVFRDTDLPYGPINNMQHVFDDPQVKHNQIVQIIKDNAFNSQIRIPGLIYFIYLFGLL